MEAFERIREAIKNKPRVVSVTTYKHERTGRTMFRREGFLTEVLASDVAALCKTLVVHDEITAVLASAMSKGKSERVCQIQAPDLWHLLDCWQAQRPRPIDPIPEQTA